LVPAIDFNATIFGVDYPIFLYAVGVIQAQLHVAIAAYVGGARRKDFDYDFRRGPEPARGQRSGHSLSGCEDKVRDHAVVVVEDHSHAWGDATNRMIPEVIAKGEHDVGQYG